MWDLTSEMEKDIDKNMIIITANDNKSSFNLTQKYLIDLDVCLLAFANLINCYPSILSIILKYHKNQLKLDLYLYELPIN